MTDKVKQDDLIRYVDADLDADEDFTLVGSLPAAVAILEEP